MSDSQVISRRAFLVTSAGVCGALAIWSLDKSRVASAASGKPTTPGMVTIVQFGADGKKMGKIQVAHENSQNRTLSGRSSYPPSSTR